MGDRNWMERVRNAVGEDRAKILSLFGVGLVIRLVLMPFFAHVDFLSEYGRMYQVVATGKPTLYLGRIVVVVIEQVSLRLFLPFLPDADTMLRFNDTGQATAGLNEYFLFVSDPHIFRTLFLLKIPYLLFDMGTVWVLFRLMAGKAGQKTALCLWLFNPVTLYAFYVFGRFESIPIFFLSLTLLLLQKGRLVLSALTLGLALNCREIIVLYLPLYGLSLFGKQWNRNVLFRRMIPALIVLFTMTVLPLWMKMRFETPLATGGGGVQDMESAQALFGMRFNWFVPFVFCYAAICLWLIEERSRDPFERFLTATGLCILSFLLLVSHSAHYVSWMVLFPIVGLYFKKPILKPFLIFCACWMATWAILTDAGVFTLFLASPLSMNFFRFKTLLDVYETTLGHFVPMDRSMLIWSMKTVYAASIAYMMVLFFRKPEARHV
uniref:DUF2029 domain-containing protein n=1 Tax=Desulfatirhabdium butyrativorans TaxID=340467 RepID=A0A7C4MKM7_9BACT